MIHLNRIQWLIRAGLCYPKDMESGFPSLLPPRGFLPRRFPPRRHHGWTIVLPLCAMLAGTSQGVEGRGGRGTPGERARRRSGRAHLIYRWAERQRGIQIRHEIHVYENGFIRYARSVGGGTPEETTLPSDPAFAAALLAEVDLAGRTHRPQPPCGAPMGGVLEVERRGRVRRHDLTDERLWWRYGRLVRRLLGRVTGRDAAPIEADCRALSLHVDPTRVGRPRARPTAPSRLEPELDLLLRYGMTDSEQGRTELLARLAARPGADRFYRWALLDGTRDSLARRRFLRRHAAVLVRGVASAAEARRLLGLLRSLQDVEAFYHRSVLQVVLRHFKAAARARFTFHELLDQTGAAARARTGLLAFRQASIDARRRRPPWGRVRRAPAKLFRFWLDRAAAVWSGDPASAPPLALLLYSRALHFAVRSVLAPSVRATGGGAPLRARARSLVRGYFPVFAAGRWERRPYWLQRDLLALVGLLRRAPRAFGKEWVAAHAEPPERVVCHMVRMRYFGPAARYVERVVAQDARRQGALLLAWGRCLAEQERFAAARRALGQALARSTPGAAAAWVTTRIDQGDVEGAIREALARTRGADADAALWVALSRARRLQGRLPEALAAARRAVTRSGSEGAAQAASFLALGRVLQAAGRYSEAIKAFRKVAEGRGAAAAEGRLRLAHLLWAGRKYKRAMDAAWPLTRHRDPRFRAAAHALLALAARSLGLRPLARLQVRCAEHHAGLDPEALTAVSELLLEAGCWLPTVSRLLSLAAGKRPRWSRVLALRAWMWARSGSIRRARAAIAAALRVRPGFPPYRLMERAVLLAVAKRSREPGAPTPRRGAAQGSARGSARGRPGSAPPPRASP